MSNIFSFINIDASVGKTSSAINLSSALSKLNYSCLVIDCDPLAKASTWLSLNNFNNKTLFDVLSSSIDINQVIKNVSKGIDILPSALSLANIEKFISNDNENQFFLLKNKIAHIKKKYDFIFLDCPSSLGLLTYNALCASQKIIIPLRCNSSYDDYLAKVLSFTSNVQKKHNKCLRILGFLINFYDKNDYQCEEVVNQIKLIFKENTFYNKIPLNQSIKKSERKKLSVIDYRPHSVSSRSYMQLAKEIIDDLKSNDFN